MMSSSPCATHHELALLLPIPYCFEYGALKWASLDPKGLENCKVGVALYFPWVKFI